MKSLKSLGAIRSLLKTGLPDGEEIGSAIATAQKRQRRLPELGAPHSVQDEHAREMVQLIQLFERQMREQKQQEHELQRAFDALVVQFDREKVAHMAEAATRAGASEAAQSIADKEALMKMGGELARIRGHVSRFRRHLELAYCELAEKDKALVDAHAREAQLQEQIIALTLGKAQPRKAKAGSDSQTPGAQKPKITAAPAVKLKARAREADRYELDRWIPRRAMI